MQPTPRAGVLPRLLPIVTAPWALAGANRATPASTDTPSFQRLLIGP